MTNAKKKLLHDKADNDSNESIAASALNEQGFLFQQRILETIEQSNDCAWTSRAVEYPVAFGSHHEIETKIDIILGRRNSAKDPWYAVVECKRASRDYKRWIFFDKKIRLVGLGRASLFLQRADLLTTWTPSLQEFPPLTLQVDRIPANHECSIYNFYVEARINRPNSGQKASATEAIEGSMRQVCVGVVGLASSLARMKATSFRLLPIVVTSADLYSAEFKVDDISIDRGHIDPENLRLEHRPWLCVNYPIDESIAEWAGLTTVHASTVGEALLSRHLRSVFVVQSNHLIPFLKWANEWVTDP